MNKVSSEESSSPQPSPPAGAGREGGGAAEWDRRLLNVGYKAVTGVTALQNLAERGRFWLMVCLLVYISSLQGEGATPEMVRVMVADILTGKPVGNAVVEVRKRVVVRDADGRSHLRSIEESAAVGRGETDGSGGLELAVDGEGFFAIEVNASGYLSQCENMAVLKSGDEATLRFSIVPQELTEEEAERVRELQGGRGGLNDQGPLLAEPKIQAAAVIVPDEVQVTNLNGYTGLMRFDEFLAGVVTAEMNDAFPTEALRAQAVASRSFALRRLQTTGSANGGQAYASNAGSLSRAAVVYTTKQILLYNGGVISAFFSARCNGDYTLDSEYGTTLSRCTAGSLGVGVVPYCRARPCSGHPNCATTGEQCCQLIVNGKTNYLYGHGVGMCQRGAQQFALRDRLIYSAILDRFYTGVTLQANPATEPPKILTNPRFNAGYFTFKVNGFSDSRYDLQISDDLRLWRTLTNLVLPPEGVKVFVDPTPVEVRRYYRAIAP